MMIPHLGQLARPGKNYSTLVHIYPNVSGVCCTRRERRGGKRGKKKKRGSRSSFHSLLLPGWKERSGAERKKKRRRQRWLESRRGTKWQQTSLGGSRIVGYLAPRGHGGSSYRTLDMPVGGSTSTGAELPGQSRPLRASRRWRPHRTSPRRGEERRADIHHRHRAPLPLQAAAFTLRGWCRASLPRHQRNRCHVNWPLMRLKDFETKGNAANCLAILSVSAIPIVFVSLRVFMRFIYI